MQRPEGCRPRERRCAAASRSTAMAARQWPGAPPLRAAWRLGAGERRLGNASDGMMSLLASSEKRVSAFRKVGTPMCPTF